MNREIKFRAWHKEHGKYYQVEEIRFDKKELVLSHYIFTFESGFDEVIIEQYTGLEDRNGVEIYECDIVEFEDIVGEVRFLPQQNGYAVITHNSDHKLEFRKYIVIGNIHENKEKINMKKFKVGDKVKGINCLNVAFENGVVAGIDYPSAFEVEVDTEYGPGQWCTHEDLTLIEELKLSIMEQAIEQYKELHNIIGTRPFYADGIQFRFKGTDLEYLEPPTWSEFLTVSFDTISVNIIDERKFEKAYASTLCKLLFNEYKFSHLKGAMKNE